MTNKFGSFLPSTSRDVCFAPIELAFNDFYNEFYNDFFKNDAIQNKVKAAVGYPKLDVVIERIEANTSDEVKKLGFDSKDFLVIRAIVPGVALEDLSVELVKDLKDAKHKGAIDMVPSTITYVRISGKMSNVATTKELQVLIREISKKTFTREVILPSWVKEDPEASLKDGILTLRWEVPEATQTPQNKSRIVKINQG